ncbi:hypothetical protein IC575_005830 [Cucumis melo]
MMFAKSCTTPVSPSLDLDTIVPPFNNTSLYRKLVGSLQYLTFTCPNIAFSVNRVILLIDTPPQDSLPSSASISWSSKKQPIVSCSSTEAEYHSLATTTVDLYWIRQLLCDLRVPHKPHQHYGVMILMLVSLAHNSIFHARTKHIEIEYHFVRKKFFRTDISIFQISFDKQLADILTKPLLSPTFLHLRNKLLTQPESSI